MRLEVDMQPLATGRSGGPARRVNQPGRQALSALRACDHGVENEGVGAAVPGHVYESHEIAIQACAHPAKADPAKLLPPIAFPDIVLEAFGVQDIQFCVLEHRPPFQRGPGGVGGIFVLHAEYVARRH